MVVQHNLAAMNSNRMLGVTTKTQTKSTEKLSSGYKINRAADDAAGLSISEKMRKQIRGLTQASLNAQDGISAVQTTEGALTEVHDMLQRMNELAVKSSNGTNSEDDRQYIQDEIDQLITEIDRVAETTKFNETYLLKGDKTTNSLKYDYVAPATVSSFSPKNTLFDICGNTVSDKVAEDMYRNGETLYSTQTTKTAAAAADLKAVSVAKADIYDAAGHMIVKKGEVFDTGLDITKFKDKSGSALTSAGALDAATIADEDLYNADGTLAYAKNTVLASAVAASVTDYNTTVALGTVAKEGTDYIFDENVYTGQLYDKDGNKIAKNGLESYFEKDSDGTITYKGGLYSKGGQAIGNADAALTEADNEELTHYVSTTNNGTGALQLKLHVGADATDNNQISLAISAMDASTLGINGIKVDGADDTNAKDAIDTIKAAIQRVSTQRSALGAVQNRLEHTINNLDNVVENTTAAESQIRDTDMATEMVKYSNNQILAQAGQAMLAQANQSNQGVLSLLQ